MEAVLEAFAARPEHKSSDSTFLVLMSHGILAGICGTTHRTENPDVLPYDTIFRMFNNCHCLSLKDKPKVIIVQACRGGEFWQGESQVPELFAEDCDVCFHLRGNNVSPHSVQIKWIEFLGNSS